MLVVQEISSGEDFPPLTDFNSLATAEEERRERASTTLPATTRMENHRWRFSTEKGEVKCRP